MEPRRPEVQEVDVSESEWGRLFDNFSRSAER